MFMTTTIPHNIRAESLTDLKKDVVETKLLNKEISDVFNKFHYDMTVEWDQNDSHFKELAQKELQNSLMDLKAQGVSNEDILAYMRSNFFR